MLAKSPSTNIVTDLSTNGIDVDTNGSVSANDGDSDPNNTDSPTPILLPRVAITEHVVGSPIDNSDGTFNVTYEVTLSNT